MPIQLTPDQEQFIQAKVQTGEYHSAEAVLAAALNLLAAQDDTEETWLETVRPAINAAYASTEPPADGPSFVHQLRQKLKMTHHE